jgi:IS30 family transposase
VGEGSSGRAAARVAGVSQSTGVRWLAKAGGMIPTLMLAPPAPSAGSVRLGFVDRCRIEDLLAEGYCPARIAVFLGRHRSTIGRELERGWDEAGKRYRATLAQAKVDQAAHRPRPGRLEANPRLRGEVVRGLATRHSPEQIAGRLRRDHPDDPEMWVSHETIYQALYVQPRGELAREVRQAIKGGEALRTGRTARRHQGRQPRQGPISNMVSISERPAEAADRAIPGHWEGDLIIGAGGKSAIGTLVERCSGVVLLLHLPMDHTAATGAAAMREAIPRLPEILRRSLTWDQGSEMAKHAEITAATGLPIYFADPHSPWQRASNENTNGLLRQYFPKGTDLSVWGPGYLDLVAAELNARPRKRHNWATPAEVLDQILSNHDRVA